MGVKKATSTHIASDISRLGWWSLVRIVPENLGDSGGIWSWERRWAVTGCDLDMEPEKTATFGLPVTTKPNEQ